ncbi:rare lipoprotein B [Alcanivorax hongdengensis A-11-3]|uniref:LPS-assembly lipoprotein LptE n=1 Tax=Alcanivorax hongdengensis A-11-3 TaxID=1177179 RepID=L0WFZ1_9GAMM|nr:LPS assembly lipoprotein LptE [Alcanivorax hongdengensis]EKF75768.1 rare lipoprotein B [Alcanivorax hongdengensis A-11-3]
MRLLRPFLVLLLTVWLSACGWQLRGATQTPSLDTVTLKGASAQLRYPLEDKLEDEGVLVHNESPYILVIEDEDWSRRTAAVDDQGRQAEIELRYQIVWHLESRDSGALLTAPKRLMALRSFAWYPDNATASSDEEQLVREDLYDDIIVRLINQLAAATQGWEVN